MPIIEVGSKWSILTDFVDFFNGNIYHEVECRVLNELTSMAKFRSVSLYPISLRRSLKWRNGPEISPSHNAATISDPYYIYRKEKYGQGTYITAKNKISEFRESQIGKVELFIYPFRSKACPNSKNAD